MVIVYILLGLLALLVVLGVAAMVFFKLAVTRRDSWKRPEEKVFGGGGKKALLLYQPSNGRHNVPAAEALAGAVAELGYTVTMNYPSEQVDYEPMDYDLLIFGSPVYMGETAKPLHKYLQAHPFTGKRVLLFVTGMDFSKSPEVEALKLMVPEGNRISAVKVAARDAAGLTDFARKSLAEPDGEELPGA